jgi:hypothetical protein
MSRGPQILTPSIRPFGPTQDRRGISKKPRASLPVRGTQTGPASALPNIVR